MRFCGHFAERSFCAFFVAFFRARRVSTRRYALASGLAVRLTASWPDGRTTPEGARAIQLVQRRPLVDRLPNDSFHVVAVPPFVVIGNESRATVERRAAETVGWAVRRLRQDFFPRDPATTIEVWLLKDAADYREHSRQMFGIEPTTPFGYFSQRHQALVMDISTGGGTLVHELVHPLMAANFPECPAWFDEGLASLYEQCGDRNGRIWGHPNWRLRGSRSVRLVSIGCTTSRRCARCSRRSLSAKRSPRVRPSSLPVFLSPGNGKAAGVLSPFPFGRRRGSFGLPNAV